MCKSKLIEKSKIMILTGEIVEIYEKKEKTIANVFANSLCIELEINSLKDVHLSDKVRLHVRYEIDKIEKENHY